MKIIKKNLFYTFLLIVFFIFLFLFMIVLYSIPSFPERWNKIKIGTKRSVVISLFPKINKEMRDIKGFDTYNIKNTFLYMDGYMHLVIYYNKQNKVNRVHLNYINKNCGLFNMQRVITQKNAEGR